MTQDARHPTKTVLVAGATGNQGGSLTRELVARGHRVRALTRNPDGPAAMQLRAAGVEVVRADLEDRPTLEVAAEGVDSVFVVATPFEAGPEAETRQATNLIDAAIVAGVPHIVYSSVASADRGTGVPHFESKFAVEKHLVASGARFTIVAPAGFMEALLGPWALPALRQGVMGSPLDAEVALQQVALADVGAFAALVIEQPYRFAGQRVEIAGDVSTGAQLAASLSRHAGRDVTYVQTSLEQAGGDDMVRMFRFLAEEGYQVDIPSLRAAYPEVVWHDRDAWAGSLDWPRLLAQPEPVAS